MPFTFSHPSVVLVLKKFLPRLHLSATALIVGSIAPDFEGFLFLHTRKTFSHTWGGIFFFDMPIGIIICFLWHNMIKEGFIDNVPLYFKKKFYRYRSFDWNKYFSNHKIVVITCLFIGAATHLVWDDYTHFNGTDYTAVTVWHLEMSVFIFRQFMSSIVGFAFILLYVWFMPISVVVPTSRYHGYWFIVMEVAAIGVFLRILSTSMPTSSILGYIDSIVMTFLSSLILGVLCSSIIFNIWKRNSIT